jgi:hypothetical protein
MSFITSNNFPGGKATQHTIQKGRYRHYKGNLYEVVDVARHSETKEKMAVYSCLSDGNSLWVRPLLIFLETVEVAGQDVPRFATIGQAP